MIRDRFNCLAFYQFSGSECDYVILSTVRSLPKSHIDTKAFKSWRRRHMGFITDEHQINVALTRAKKGFIIIGKMLYGNIIVWKFSSAMFNVKFNFHVPLLMFSDPIRT